MESSSFPENCKFFPTSCSFSLAQHADRRRKMDFISQKGFSLSYEERKVRISVLTRHLFNVLSIQNMSPNLAELHLKITLQTQCREK